MQQVTRRSMLRTLGLAAALPSAATLAGCSASGNAPVVTMQNFTFQPRRLTVAPGTTVEWTNDSDDPHTVTAHEDEIPETAAYFASGDYQTERAARNDVGGGLVGAGDSFTHTFEVPGTYRYYCIPHESSGMAGEIVVE